MKRWSVQNAKAWLSGLRDICLREGLQLVAKRSTEVTALFPLKERQRSQHHAKPTLEELLLVGKARATLNLHKRGGMRRREPREIV